MRHHYHCTTVYHLSDVKLLKNFVKKVNVYSNDFSSRVRNATKRYIEYLNKMSVERTVKEEEPIVFTESGELENLAMNNLFANNDYRAMQDTIHRLQSELEITKSERDEANRKLHEAESKNKEYEKTVVEEMVVEHEELVANVFCEIAQRYMESCKRKKTDQRTLIKNSLHDIMSQLKMFGRIPNDLQKCINNFDDETTPDIPHVLVQGDYVLQKHVDSEVNHVDEGGTGITRK